MIQSDIEKIIAELEKELPVIFPRSAIKRLTGGIYSPSYMAVLDCHGKGPEGKIRVGKQVCYQKGPFLEWLKARMSAPQKRIGISIPARTTCADTMLDSLHLFSNGGKNSWYAHSRAIFC